MIRYTHNIEAAARELSSGYRPEEHARELRPPRWVKKNVGTVSQPRWLVFDIKDQTRPLFEVKAPVRKPDPQAFEELVDLICVAPVMFAEATGREYDQDD